MEELLLTINGKEFKAQYDNKDKSLIYINGNPYHVELMKKYGNNIFSFSINQRLKQIELDNSEPDAILLAFEGVTHRVDITNETKKLLKTYLLQSSSTEASGKIAVKAPMSGLVVKCLVSVGAQIEKGGKLLIIEAMKMENAINSPIQGIVRTIKVQEGIAVAKDAILIEIDKIN